MMDSWSEERLNQLISSKEEEHLHLEYKAAEALTNSDGKKKELSKDISAMANADGGTIIYGIKEFDDKKSEHLPEKITPIKRSQFPKEWLEQVINSNIQPRIQGIVIHSVQLQSDPDDVAYVVEIPKSTTAHQAKDFRYHKRYNFQVLEMHDHEIRDVMNRTKHPVLCLNFLIQVRHFQYFQESDPFMRPVRGSAKRDDTTSKLFVIAKNQGMIFAKYVNACLAVPSEILEEKHGNEHGYLDCIRKNAIQDVVDIKGTYPHFRDVRGPARYEPILPDMTFEFKSFKLVKNIQEIIANQPDLKLLWVLYADNAQPQEGEIKISDIEFRIIDERE